MEKNMSDQNKKENQTEIKLILVKDKKRPTSYVQKEIFDKPFDKLVKKDGCVIN